MRFYLIRHAQSRNNAIRARTGLSDGCVPDPDITTIGHQQAQCLANLLADESAELRPSLLPGKRGFGLTHLYCSLMTRTIQTATYVAETCGMRLTALEDVFERGGVYDINQDGVPVGALGPTRSYFEARFPHLILPESLGEKAWYNQPYETVDMFVERMKSVVPRLINRHLGTEDHVAFVTHGHFMDQFLNEIMGVPRHRHNYSVGWQVNWAFHNSSVSRIDFIGDAQIVMYLNRIDHLSAELMT